MLSYIPLSLCSSVILVILRTAIPVHACVSKVVGVVGPSVQQDGYGFPAIYSSSIKGVFKTALIYSYMKRLKNNCERTRGVVKVLLGPELGETETFEFSIAILNAYTSHDN